MIAEIYSKITKHNSNLSEISEDELTGNFFGHLRYRPFNEGLKPILKNAVFPSKIGTLIDNVDVGFWNNNIEFWPYDKEGELDAYIEFDHLAMGIEVKYTSGLSSDDNVDYSLSDERELEEESRNQLQRESRIITRRAGNKAKILLLVGSAMACADIYTNITKRKLFLSSDVTFGYVTWQSLLRELLKLKFDNPFSSLIISDLIALLARKGFDQFQNMELDIPCSVSCDEH
ncbi:hypothetical protein [Faecalicatena contorta]|uniref:hypothetical protein n=1 Tax=Faecalicatena contorta TaxID=39482 RepID=UPI000D6D8393|nr:hypothetical protein [Faecalicatena contorta]